MHWFFGLRSRHNGAKTGADIKEQAARNLPLTQGEITRFTSVIQLFPSVSVGNIPVLLL